MRHRLREELKATKNVHIPLPIHYEDMREERDKKKKAIKTRLLDDMATLDNWTALTLKQNRQMIEMGKLDQNLARIELNNEYKKGEGKNSLKFTSPTRIPGVPHSETWPGGIMCIPSAYFKVNEEDWREWNRISCWVYTDMPNFMSPYLRMQFHNGGDNPVPDRWDRAGHHNFNLQHGQWFFMSVEIPYLHRDKVIGLSFDYDMCGSQVTACSQATWYISDLRLEKLAEEDLDHYSGWNVGNGRIAFSHSGYKTQSQKTAVLNDPSVKTFRIFESQTAKNVLEKEVKTIKTSTGDFQILDFTELTAEGEYFIACGDTITRTFPVGDKIWEDSIWKTINFMFCERCGTHVPNKHYPCCLDRFVEHEGIKLHASGGWHDAADMAQNFINTAEISAAFFALLDSCAYDSDLYERVLEEGRWGLEWMLKTRFGDGFRAHSVGGAHWTLNRIGDGDDRIRPARYHCHNNFIGAAVQAIGYTALKKSDPVYAEYSLKCAKEDWDFAAEGLLNEGIKTEYTDHAVSPVTVYSSAVWAGVELYKVTGDDKYKDGAKEYAKFVLRCQQQQIPDWDIPLTGFFHRQPDCKIISRGAHRSQENTMMMALCGLCETFPNDPDWIDWYYGVVLYSENQKKVFEYTAPFYMAPCSIYHEDEIDWDEDTFIQQHAQMRGGGMTDEIRAQFAKMLNNGVKLGKGYYLRRFPVWYSFRGNHSPVLSAGKAAAQAAKVRNDNHLAELATRQLEWIVGKNPFAESLMFGEGYDYCQHYTVCPGEMVGQLTVGVPTMDNLDEPFWPHVNTCTYKEVWGVPGGRWAWLAADVHGLEKYEKPGDVTVSHVIEGSNIKITLQAGSDAVRLWEVRAKNITIQNDFVLDGKITLEGKIVDLSYPYLAVLIPGGDLDKKIEVY
jgi:hypothetical protein